MRLPRRDVIASGLVGVAGLLYVLWAVGFAPPGLSGVRATGIAILVLGVAASASAVVPTFDRLLHGSKTYLALTSTIGLVALVSGVWVLASASEIGLGVMVISMLVLWLITTIHHSSEANNAAKTDVRHRELAHHGR